MSAVRFDLIDEAIAWAEAEAAKGRMSAWRQDAWAQEAPCGTAYCIAGHVAVLDGWRPVAVLSDWRPSAGWFWRKGEHHAEMPAVGIEVLNLPTEGDADLFSSDNTIGDLKRIRDEYARDEGVPERYSSDEKGEPSW